MPVLALGVSHRRAGGRAARAARRRRRRPAQGLRPPGRPQGIREAVVLSTCNRIEVYAEVTGYHAGFQDLRTFLAESSGLEPDAFAEPLYAHYEDEAVEHLFGVAAGIDSMIVGEPQILSQVRHASAAPTPRRPAARSWPTCSAGPCASAAGPARRPRSARAPLAFVQAGLAAGRGGPRAACAGTHALVVGAGQMGGARPGGPARAAAWARPTSLNRTPERAERLAARHGARARSLADLARRPGGRGRRGRVDRRRRAGRPRGRRARRRWPPARTGRCSCSTWPCPATWSRPSARSRACRVADIDALRAAVVDERELEEVGRGPRA